MPHVRRDLVIARPVQIVFDFLADRRNEPGYNGQILRIDALSEDGVGAGSRWSALVRTGRWPTNVAIECIEYQRPLVLGVDHDDAGRRVRPAGDLRARRRWHPGLLGLGGPAGEHRSVHPLPVGAADGAAGATHPDRAQGPARRPPPARLGRRPTPRGLADSRKALPDVRSLRLPRPHSGCPPDGRARPSPRAQPVHPRRASPPATSPTPEPTSVSCSSSSARTSRRRKPRCSPRCGRSTSSPTTWPCWKASTPTCSKPSTSSTTLPRTPPTAGGRASCTCCTSSPSTCTRRTSACSPSHRQSRRQRLGRDGSVGAGALLVPGAAHRLTRAAHRLTRGSTCCAGRVTWVMCPRPRITGSAGIGVTRSGRPTASPRTCRRPRRRPFPRGARGPGGSSPASRR